MGYLSCRSDSSISSSSTSPIHVFSYSELDSATRHFSPSSLLGRGSHGSVFRADLPHSPLPLAVKRPSLHPHHSSELHILSHLRSPRIVNLIGFTPPSSTHHTLLVFEFMPNGTLYQLLHSSPRPPGWSRRLRLALQTALAVLTLHSAKPPVIHRDIKSANVLLDHNHNARLGDFGLALTYPVPPGAPPAGTLGYLDPGYLTPDNLSTKTDVFSFGILLLEIMTGRKAIDVAYSPPSVVDWAVPLLKKGRLGGLFDPRIAPPRDVMVRKQLAGLVLSCVRTTKEKRPAMGEVVAQLKVICKMVSARTWNGLAVGNPCSVVDTERTLLRLNPNGGDQGVENETCAEVEEEERRAGTMQQQLHSSLKTVQLSRNGNKVFSEESTTGARNLKELMARLDSDPVGVLGQRSSIRRSRTLRVTSNYHDKDDLLRLWRNRTIKDGLFDPLPRFNEIKSLESKTSDRAAGVV